MNQHLQNIIKAIEQNERFTAEEKANLIKSAKEANKVLEITEFKLDRTEKVKRTTAVLLEETIAELEQKRKAIEAQNRELQIESALERVRARAMAMQNSDELKELIVTVFTELTKLDLVLTRCLIMIFDPVTNGSTWWMANSEDASNPMGLFVKYHELPPYLAYMKSWKEKKNRFQYILEGDDKKGWDDFIFLETELTRLPEFVIAGMKAPTRVYLSASFNNFGCLNLASLEPLSDEHFDILLRFAKVFDLTYTRFNDLQKAEAQAREARIEAALERVRSRTMAMHKSEELSEAAFVLFQQFKELGEEPERIFIATFDEVEEDIIDLWGTNQGGKQLNKLFRVPATEPTLVSKIITAWKEKKRSIVIDLRGEELEKYLQFLKTSGIPVIEGVMSERRVQTVACFSKGVIGITTPEPRPAASVELLERFAGVFNLTYTRFLDLVHAEAQARESQIQLALERVRARTMAMQKSDELAEVATVLFQQVKALGVPQWVCGFNIWEIGDKEFTWYPGSPDGEILAPCKVPLTEHPVFISFDESRRRGDELFVYEKEGEFQAGHYRYMMSVPGMRELLQNMLDAGLQFPAFQIDHLANFSHGNLVFITYEPVPEMHDVFKRFAKVFEQTYTRFLDLQKAEAQAREAQIELGLERVRARAMAMQKSDELAELVDTVFRELTKLDVHLDRCIIMINDPKTNGSTWWLANPEAGSVPVGLFVKYHEHQPNLDYINAWKKRTLKWRYLLEGKNKKEWDNFLFTETDLSLLPDFVIAGMKSFDRIFLNVSFNNFGSLTVSSVEPLQEEHFDIMLRFAKVFDLTYTRFNDLQKAEAQAREAQIELGLERVRARAMAMQRSDELSELVDTVFKELTKLDFALTWCIINIIDESTMSNTVWAANPDINKPPESYHMLFEDYPFHHAMMKGWKERKAKDVYVLEGQEKKVYDEYLFNETEFRRVPVVAQAASRAMEKYVVTFSFSNFGGLQTVGDTPLSESNLDILSRFGKVFDLTYTRFNDLKLAESQARESQIQLAMERVRARTMAMQKSDELPEAANLLFRQVQSLGMPAWSAGYCIWDDDKKAITLSMSSEGVLQPSLRMPLTEDPSLMHFLEAYQRGESFFVEEVGGEVLKKHYTYLRTLPGVKETLDDIEKAGFPVPTFQIFHCAYFSKGFLLFITYEPVPDAHDIFKRFANVFEQTYTRFLDLQKAEAQVRESELELALERVRAKSMSMRHSDELADLVKIVFKELTRIGFSVNACIIMTYDETTNDSTWWIANFDGVSDPLGLLVPNHSHEPYLAYLNEWKKQTTKWRYKLGGAEKKKWDQYIFKNSGLATLPDVVKKGMQSVEDVYLNVCFNKYASITFGSFEPMSDKDFDTLHRFAKVFEQSYTRFLDLQKAEAQAREAQIEAALERVRSRSMGMQKSEELSEVIKVVYQQLTHLNINLDHAGFVVDYKPGGDWHFWIADERDIPSKITHPYFESVWANQFNEAKVKGEDYFVTHLNFEEKNKFYQELLSYVPGLPAASKDFYLSCPGFAATTVLFNNVSLYIENFSGIPYSDEENSILKRFGKVFQQTYTRFLDLQKAEVQTRDAQIEVAVERVRAKALAMHKSEDLHSVVVALKKELTGLRIPDITAATIYLEQDDGSIRVLDLSDSGQEDDNKPQLQLDKVFRLEDTDPGLWIRRMWNRSENYFVLEADEDDFVKVVQWVRTVDPDGAAIAEKIIKEKSIKKAWLPTVRLEKGVMNIDLLAPPTPEIESILLKMGAGFDLAYRRFLDLQKAEAQAREAQIEAALEKVRSRSLAMHKSDELQEVVNTVFERLKELNLEMDSANIAIFKEGVRDLDYWIASPFQKRLASFHMAYIDLSLTRDITSARESGKDFSCKSYSFEEKNEWFDYAFKHTDFKFLSEERKQFILGAPAITVAIAFAKHTGVQVNRYSAKSLSEGETEILKRFSKVFEQAYIRFLDLEKAEAQAREAQIEASLERVRSKTMAMHNSNDVGDTVATLFDELVKLGVETTRCGVGIMHDDYQMELWTAKSEGIGGVKLIIGTLDMKIHPLLTGVYESWIKKERHYSYELKDEDLIAYYNAINNLPNYPIQYDINSLPSQIFQNTFGFHEGILFAFTLHQLTAESSQIFKRFAGVFGQTYRRYLDLQKAEAQAKESQIEVGLERVRARTMAMHSSEDVSTATATMFTELEKLNIQNFRGGIVNIRPDQTMEVWSVNTLADGTIARAIGDFDMRLHPWWQLIFKVWKKEEFIYYRMEGKEKEDYIRILDARRDYLPNGMQHLPDCHVQSYFFGEGAIWTMSLKPHSEEDKLIMKRFAYVFSLTFRRYQDLKKAEAQAKEATIEAALERVRGKAMAMHNSQDLTDTIGVFYKELQAFSLTPRRCGVGLLNKEEKIGELSTWNTTEKGESLELVGKLKMEGHPVLEGVYEHWITQQEYHPVLRGNEIKEYYKIIRPQIAFPDYEHEAVQYGYFFFFKEGGVYAWTEKEMKEEELQIYRRFTSVFSLTYKRYKDLKQAEASAKEAVRQASLDRVRAEIASMRTVEDLQRITPIIWNELTTLNIPFIRCGIFIMDDEHQLIHTFLSTPDGKAIAAFHLPYDTPGNLSQVISNWKVKKKYIDHWDEKEFIQFSEILVKQGALASSDQYLKTIPHGGFYLHFLPFLQGMLYVGNTNQLSNDEIELIQHVADAFSTAYARYEDFNKLEAAKQQVENTLADLKQAQQQLVQSEKMASLGELTAGIAHEIQNPLNFVNNFSDVSNELLEEVKCELEKGNKEDVIALVEDVKQNLEKILHHGKRADAIVKGMLQHSRTSSGQKEPTDLNSLADEYLRLAFHGLRAKDKTFNAKFETHFDESIGKVNIIPQEIGRVILNLINNAFYTVSEKKKKNQNGYEPTVTVTTLKNNGKVEIKVKDNGDGIPPRILDKIFQPFFTTKPTGQGTGLGLSLAYDIITKGHNGELKVETKEGVGSEFIVQLPVSKTSGS